jgi:hypothetical protein
MLDRQLKRRNQHFGWAVAIALISAALGLGAYLIHTGSTDSWPETGCIIVGTRVVRADQGNAGRVIVMYQGEYQLRYTVDGHDHYIWVNSGWADADRQFVQGKVDANANSRDCDFRIHYNPNHPSEAVAERK